MLWRFIHIPKTGGTAIRRVYGQGNCGELSPQECGELAPRVPTSDSRSESPTLNLRCGHLPASCFPPDVFCWALLRNPFDRAVSICGHLYRGLGVKITPRLFRQWVRDDFPTSVKQGSETVAFLGYACDALQLKVTDPQARWIDDRTQLLPYWDLERHLHALVRQLGLEPQALPRVNESNRDRGYLHYYDDKTLITVHDRYRQDFKLYDALADKIPD